MINILRNERPQYPSTDGASPLRTRYPVHVPSAAGGRIRHQAQGRSTLIPPEHTEYSLDCEIADRVSIQAATILGPHDAAIINRTTRPVRGFTLDFTPLGAVELLGIPQAELVNRCLPADEHLSQSWERDQVVTATPTPA